MRVPLTFITLLALAASPASGQASKPFVNNEHPRETERQLKRVHPAALKMILKGREQEAIDYLKSAGELGVDVNPQHTDLLLKIARKDPQAWKFDASSWPMERSLPDTTLKQSEQGKRFGIAFGGGAGYVPSYERMWDTIRQYDPRALLLLGDNVYIDDPQTPEMQLFHYYRRQSQPEWRKLVARIPVYAIWDDHDFSTNDSWGGPKIDDPAWKRDVWNVFKQQWDNPFYGGGEEQPGCWFDLRIGDVHFFLIDGRYYREDPRSESPSMLGPAQLAWLEKTLGDSDATFKVLCSNVPMTPGVKRGSKDTWDGYAGERQRIWNFIADNRISGVVVLAADRHRSDAYRIDTGIEGMYPIHEFQSSRLTNQHTHPLMKHALFGYNQLPSFGWVEFDTAADDPSLRYTIVNIDGEKTHSLELKLSGLDFK